MLHADHWSILQLRALRGRIRQLVNLVGSGQRIREEPGSWFSANLEERIVYWIPTWPWPGGGRLDDLGIRYCMAHEVSHVKWSGLYVTKRIPRSEKQRFHRFVNAIEDIRVDRMSARQFGGFREAKLHTDLLLRAWQIRDVSPGKWSLTDVVKFNAIYAFDIGEPPVGPDLAVKASERLWPRLDRIANLRSTQEVATALEPIFLRLRQVERQEEERKRQAEEERRRQEAEKAEQRRQEAEAERQQREQEQSDPGSDPGGEEPSDQAGDDAEAEEPSGADSSGRDGGEEQQPPADADEEAETALPGGGGGEEPEEDDAGEDTGEIEPGHLDGDGESDEDEPVGGEPEEISPSEVAGLDGLDPEEEEEEPEPDPLAPLDELPKRSPGADEPTDEPIKSDGDPDTAPLDFAEELDGIADDCDDFTAQGELRGKAAQKREEERQGRQLRDKQLGKRTPATAIGQMRYEQTQNELRGPINALANRLRAVLRQNAMENPRTGMRRGRFDSGKAYRAKGGSVRIFKRPGTAGGLDYTFALLVDVSGSMFGSAFYDPVSETTKTEAEAAFEATVLIAEALERAGLGVFLILWDKEMRHVKPLAEPLVAHRGSLGEVLGDTKGGPSTIEAPALARAIDELAKVPGRRMLITITDGGTETVDESTELLEEISSLGIKAITIRIGGDPAPYYGHGFRVEHANELSRLLPKLINQVVRRTAA